MRVKMCVYAIVCLATLFAMNAPVEAASRAIHNSTFGIPTGLTFLEWSQFDANNNIIGKRGINWGLGFQSKTYFKPVYKQTWNSYWQWGTWFLLIPYAGFGTEYVGESMFFEVGTFYIAPYIGFGWHF